MSPKASISVVIPCWNAEKHIPEMLDSIMAQTFGDWAVWVVDDCSTDRSRDIVSEYSARDERIRLVVRDRTPKGAQTCRNIGFNCSAGSKYVIFFDADDLISPFCLQQRFDFMESHPELDFGVFPAWGFKNVPDEYPYHRVWGYNLFEDDLKAMIDETQPMVGWTNIYRYSSLESRGLIWDENITSLQDSDWNISSILAGLKYDYAHESGARPDYFYRIGISGSVSRKIMTAPQMASHCYFLDKTWLALSPRQRRAYRMDFAVRIVRFIEGCGGSDEMAARLLGTKVMKSNPSLLFRTAVWRLLRFKGARFIFSRELHRRDAIFATWNDLRNRR